MAWLQLLVLAAACSTVLSHGRVLLPPSRASAWRFGYPTPKNYDDDGLNCGGFGHQHFTNGGKCGICGDPYDWKIPRPHEIGGTYGQGIIVAKYESGSILTVTVDLTVYHRGYWEFKICPDPQNNEQECFDDNLLEFQDGGTKFYPSRSDRYTLNYRIPRSLSCDHCVLQWRYICGNNWGVCNNGTQGVGCGPQETFSACSDITIIGNEFKGLQEIKSNDISITNDLQRFSYAYGTRSFNKRPKAVTQDDIPYPLFFYLRHGFFDLEKGKVLEEFEVDVVNSVNNVIAA